MSQLKLGIQLYTVREVLKTDYKGTIKALADIGFKGLEGGSHFGGMEPEEALEFFNSLGMKVCGFHMPLDELMNPESKHYKVASLMGTPCVTISLCGEVEKDWLGTIEKVAKAGQVSASKGFIFTYHNHADEFKKIDGEYALDLLYRKTDPKEVQAELDTYWIKKGGEDPVAYIKKYAGRLPQLHLKDMDPEDQSFTELGAGLMDMPAIFEAAKEAGTEWIIYEQDTCKGNPIDSCKISYDAIKNYFQG